MLIRSILSIFKNSDNSFTGEEAGEKTILVLRRHPFVMWIKLLFFALLAVLPPLVDSIFAAEIYHDGLVRIFLFLSSLWYLFVWSAAFYSLTMYTLDVWIVTDRRIIDSTQKGFFNRTVSELHLSRVQDVSVKTEGVIQTFLKFGDLQIQTAGTEERFNFMQVPDPERVKDEIMRLTSLPHHHEI